MGEQAGNDLAWVLGQLRLLRVGFEAIPSDSIVESPRGVT